MEWAIAAGNALNGNFNGPETRAYILDNKKRKEKLFTLNTYIFFFKSCVLILAH